MADTMTAGEVRAALLKRWPPSEYLSIEEAPQDAMRQGRKIDVLVVSLWKSRGHELDAVEVKVSMSDYKREIDNAQKADWWWSHVHRFWVAVPEKMAAKAAETLPTSWGLLSCTPDGTKVVVKAERHKPEPLPWTSVIGIMRSAANAGFNALQWAESRGRDLGRKMAEERFERTNGDDRLKERIEQLQGQIAAFEQASGLKLATYSGDTWTAQQVGRLVKIAESAMRDPDDLTRALERARDQARHAATLFEKAHAELAATFALDTAS